MGRGTELRPARLDSVDVHQNVAHGNQHDMEAHIASRLAYIDAS